MGMSNQLKLIACRGGGMMETHNIYPCIHQNSIIVYTMCLEMYIDQLQPRLQEDIPSFRHEDTHVGLLLHHKPIFYQLFHDFYQLFHDFYQLFHEFFLDFQILFSIMQINRTPPHTIHKNYDCILKYDDFQNCFNQKSYKTGNIHTGGGRKILSLYPRKMLFERYTLFLITFSQLTFPPFTLFITSPF